MAVVGFPLDAVDDVPSYTGRELRETLSVLVGGGTSARPLAGGSGVNPRTPADTVTATATTWTVKAHGGYIDAQTDGEAAGYLYAVNSSGGLPTGAMAAANATNPRIDLISVQVNDPAEGDGSTVPTVGVVYTTGNPAASPAVPTKPARSLVLATVAVPKFGAGSPVVSWVAPPIVAAGAGSKVKTVRNTAAGATGVNATVNLHPDITIPANPFGDSPYLVEVTAAANCNLNQNQGFKIAVILDATDIGSNYTSVLSSTISPQPTGLSVNGGYLLTSVGTTHTVSCRLTAAGNLNVNNGYQLQTIVTLTPATAL